MGIKLLYSGNFSKDRISDNLKDIIDLAISLYPSRTVDLFLAGHGDGWTSFPPRKRAVIYESDGRGGIYWLGTKQFVDRVLSPLRDEGVRIGILGFDECLMAELSTLLLMAPYADVIVASPDTEQAIGWGGFYAKIPEVFSSDRSLDAARLIVDCFRNYYVNDYLKNAPPSVYFVGLTAVRTSVLKSIARAFDDFTLQMRNSLDTSTLRDYFVESSPDFNSSSESPIMATVADYRKINFSEDSRNDAEISGWLEKVSVSLLDFPVSFPSNERFGFDPYNLAIDEALVSKALSLGSSFRSDSDVGYSYYKFYPNMGVYTSGKNLIETFEEAFENGSIYRFFGKINSAGGNVYDLSNRTSGIYVVWPFTAPTESTVKVNPCTYPNYVNSFSPVLGNFTSFVGEVIDIWWDAANETGTTCP